MQINTDFQIIQIGTVVLKGVNQTKFDRIKKTSYTENQYSDGSSDNSYLDLRSDIDLEFSCQFDKNNYDDKLRLQVVLNRKVFVCFFVRYEKYNGTALKTNTIYRDFQGYVPTIYFGYAKTNSNLPNDYSNSNSKFTEVEANILVYPRLYRADEYISFVPKANETQIPLTFWGGGATWGGGQVWGQFWSLITKISTLNLFDLNALFTCNNCGCSELQNVLVAEDIYVNPYFTEVSSYRVREKSSNIDTYTNLVITNSTLDQTITTTHPTWGIMPQKDVFIEINRQNTANTILINALTQNDFLEIKNLNNNSGFKLLWKSAIPSPQFVQIRFDTNTLYDVTSGLVEINNSFYSLETTGDNNEGLFFEAGQIANPIFEPNSFQTLQVKAILPTLGTNKMQVKITNYLTTY